MYVLAVGQVDTLEDGVEVGRGLAVLVLVQEDGRASQLQAQLLNALAVVHREQEALSAPPRPHRRHHREVLREHAVWGRGRGERKGGKSRVISFHSVQLDSILFSSIQFSCIQFVCVWESSLV